MRKVVISTPGGQERLQIVESDLLPQPAPGEVLVETQAIGVNYADVLVRLGLYSSARRYVGWPITPGFEFAGRIAATGPGVEDLPVGSEVLGVTRFGGYATHLVVPRSQVFARPPGISAVEAAGFPTVFVTAYYAWFELAHPRGGEQALVHSAAGGVGGALLQLGRVAKCRVVGVVGASSKEEVARALGADEVIDKSQVDLWRAAERLSPDGYDLIFDANGISTLRQSYQHLRPAGRLIIYGFHSMLPRGGGRPSRLKLLWDVARLPRFNPLHLTETNRSVLAFNLSYLFDHGALLQEAMGRLLRWLEEGAIRPSPTQTYPLARVGDAHRDLESGRTTGKLVLLP